MRSTVLSFVTLAAVAYAQFTVNTPANVAVCEPILIQWSGGTPPYFPSVLPGGQPSAPALESFASQTGTSLTWLVNEPTGTSLGITIRDNDGNLAQSAPFTVNAGASNSSCLNQTASVSAGTAAPTSGGSPTAGSGASSPPASPTSGGSSGSSSSGAGTSASSGSSSPAATGSSNTSGTLSDRVAQAGIACVLAAIAMVASA